MELNLSHLECWCLPYDCDDIHSVPGFYIPFVGGGSGHSVMDGMFVLTSHSGAQGLAPYLGACLL